MCDSYGLGTAENSPFARLVSPEHRLSNRATSPCVRLLFTNGKCFNAACVDGGSGRPVALILQVNG